MKSLSAQEVAAKMNSKSEFYWILVNDMDAFLPAQAHVTVFHLRDLFSGKRKVSDPLDSIGTTCKKHLYNVLIGLLYKILANRSLF